MQDVTEEWNQVALLCFRTVVVQKVRKRMKYCFVWCANPLTDFCIQRKFYLFSSQSQSPLLRKFRSIRMSGREQNEDDKKLFRGGREIFWNRQKFEHSRAATLHRRNFVSSVNSVCYWSSSRPVSTTLFVRRVSDPLAFCWACCRWQHLRDYSDGNIYW